MRNLLLTFVVGPLILFCGAAWSANPNTMLVLDMRNAPELPEHFRTTTPVANTNIDWTGFSELHMAAGAQFSKMSLDKILKTLHTKKMTIIDLREESHGFLNSNSISWYAPHNAANANKTPAEIEENQATLLTSLDDLEQVTVYKIVKKTSDGEIEKTKPIDFAVHQVLTEEELADSVNLPYYRLYVQDYHGPKNAEVDRFVNIVKNIPKGEWIYLHCRAGVGRSSTFMIMYDMMHNAKKVTFKDLLARQTAIGGKDLTHLPPPNQYKYKFALDRLTFLHSFYNYALANKDNFKTSYSEWLAEKH